ncbi:MAG: demethoxyubiquinone hydroxylase family protein [Burkholderiales bacterium]|jgi:ubiquinone biosynthesis monooxygenase Coq7|nr:demethoxyubiquinone hydroxylase family protein [Burkholderiales bacterium]
MLDKIIIEVDKMVKTLFTPATSKRVHPDERIEEGVLSVAQRKHVLGLMRVNHCGEVCAQGLYQGQALTARDKSHAEKFQNAAFEEIEHLAWTEHRILELGGRTSFLNPLFYVGSLVMGISAGVVGDKWNLGFLAETERQVGAHLASHLEQLPAADNKSRAILQQMKEDEAHHEDMANNYGAINLPPPVRKIMSLTSKAMTKITYYI